MHPPRFNFEESKIPQTDFELHEMIIEDRGSKYSVSFGRVAGKDDIRQFLLTQKARKKYAKATHNSWAARIRHNGILYETKNDDGETGAGLVILRAMQKEQVSDCIICVTRWFGGTKLMNDRFKHLQTATKHAIEHI